MLLLLIASVVSDSVRPHRQQPTRLLCPWDSSGKNTGVGCHFLLQCMKVKSESEVSQSCPTLCDPMDRSLPGSSVHGIVQARIWSGLPFPSPGDLTGPGIKLRSPEMAGKFFRVWATGVLGTHLVLFFTFPWKGGPSLSTFQGGDEGRGLLDCSPFPYPLLGRSAMRWVTRL